MTGSNGEKHPFLDDLADDAELRGTVLRRPVSGRDNIKRLVEAAGTLYTSQQPTFYGAIDRAISCNTRQHFAAASIWKRWGSLSATRRGSCSG
ncbi:hypothetical protein A4U53_037835 (plasmid) [Rhizobium ruizarguesonis]|uniref:Uncharacterized protein n=1 Tax=Rhizobium ruizarguesonis TaxID=2081791 RepID=A0ACD5EWD8_9HYPH|nr:hypothetical protein [Rhizobium leguminosarum]